MRKVRYKSITYVDVIDVQFKDNIGPALTQLIIRHKFYTIEFIMEKIKNGDPVFYKNLKGTIYGKPRENKYKGLLYTVKIGEDYIKASAHELTLNAEDLPTPNSQFVTPQARR